MKKKLILITYDLLNAMHYRQELLDFLVDYSSWKHIQLQMESANT